MLPPARTMMPAGMDSIEKELEAIRADRSLGAAQLAERAVRVMGRACILNESEPKELLIKRLVDLARRLRDLRPSMAPLGNIALVFLDRIRQAPPASSRIEQVTDLVQGIIGEQGERMDRLIAAAKGALESVGSVLTLSYSSTVERVLLEALPEDREVVVAEARPGMEGRTLFARLKRAGRNVRYITDAQMGLFMRRLDLLLLGADTICCDLAAVNKAGSYLAALAAQDLGKDCYVCADTLKINFRVDSRNVELEEGSGRYLWPQEAERCVNILFEPVPADLITRYVTDKGVLTQREMRDQVAAWKGLAQRLRL